MTKEKFEALGQARLRVENLGLSLLERIKASCQRAEVDSLDAWERAETGISKAYHQGEAAAYVGVLNLIREVEK